MRRFDRLRADIHLAAEHRDAGAEKTAAIKTPGRF